MYSDVATIDQTQSFRQFTLNSAQFALHLPTMKVCAVVLNDQFEIHFWSAAA
jgi:hypothetical protein